jgi:seryl-tRNA synthetase
MLSIKEIRENPEIYKLGLIQRGLFEGDLSLKEASNSPEKVSVPLIDKVLKLDKKRRDLLYRVEEIKRFKNEASKEIGPKKKKGEDISEILAEMQKLGNEGKEKSEELKSVEEELNNILITTPNIPDKSVPAGIDENDNLEIRKWSEPTKFDFTPLPHYELGEKLGMMDIERAAKISGSRFNVLYDSLALLEWSLMRFMIDEQTKAGYRLTLPPFMVNGDSMYGTGQLPKFSEDAFKCENNDLYLVPTAEVPVTNLHRNEILDEEKLTLKYCAYTPCFRSEAGSYGKDMKGILRQHQFNKVELVKFSKPENSDKEHELLLNDAENILKKLELPYRVVLLCSKDMGFSAQKCYDIEVWLPAEDKYREISSCSNFGDFQARRANIRFRPKDGGKPEFVHTLNGSGLAIGRTLIAIMENYQQKDGSIKVPKVLIPYMGMEVIKND